MTELAPDEEGGTVGRDRRHGEKDEPVLTTRIDGEDVRLLVHIEPLDDAGDGATGPDGPSQAPPPDRRH